jgi:hypothetical protein
MTMKTKVYRSIDEQQHRSPHERSEMRDQIRNPDIALPGYACFAANLVVLGLVPGIHVLAELRKTWMAGTKPGHDEENEGGLEHR